MAPIEKALIDALLKADEDFLAKRINKAVYDNAVNIAYRNAQRALDKARWGDGNEEVRS